VSSVGVRILLRVEILLFPLLILDMQMQKLAGVGLRLHLLSE
jgi:hypothetical protein